MKVGIAGGIGSGKSYVAHRLATRGISVYDCDSAAKRLMNTSSELRHQLTELVGPDCYKENKANEFSLNKAAVSRFLLASEENAQAINAIVHPAVATDFQQSGMQWMECAILYESAFDRLVDRVIVVTAPEEVRLQRIMQRDGISEVKARKWMGRQWPQDKVRCHADFEIINDGKTPLIPQIEAILNTI